MKLEIWSLGKTSDNYIQMGLDTYFKKVKPYQQISLRLFQHKLPGSASVAEVKNAEAELILNNLDRATFLVLLDERGIQYNSPQWAGRLQNIMNKSSKQCIFLIGGAHGVSEKLMHRANETWSLSKMVLPHQLVRLVLAEQLYRAYSILNNSSYHHA